MDEVSMSYLFSFSRYQTKCEYLENKKSFLDEIKTSFIVFEGLSFGEE